MKNVDIIYVIECFSFDNIPFVYILNKMHPN